MSLTKILRKQLQKSPCSFLQIEKKTGVKRQTLMKFIKGQQSLRLDMADRLVQFFKLSILENNE